MSKLDASSTPSPSSTLILVADDDMEILGLTSLTLKRLGYNIVEASDGEKALDMIKKVRPQLVVLDVMMPGMSGWEVCQAVRRDTSYDDIKILMLTGIGERLNAMTSPLYGANGFLDKPFELEDLESKVKEMLLPA